MATRTIKVGFDFDGVIAYNPLRILRAPFVTLRRIVTHKKDLEFPIPKTKTSRFLWTLAHKTSYFPAAGVQELKELLKKREIEGYLITGRYGFLKDDLEKWLSNHNLNGLFKEMYVNSTEQPHLFKERMVKKLGLDYYLEDNWDIVNYLRSKKLKPEIHWIYNIVDRFNPYPHKHPYLRKFLQELEKISSR